MHDTFYKIVIASIVATAAAGCATSPMSSESMTKKERKTGPEFGQWRGQGSASRLVKNESGTRLENWTVKLEVVAKTPGFGRIEITGAMGVYGGTIAWNQTETRILIPGQRSFIFAPNSTRSFIALLPVQISPGEVEALLFDRDFDLPLLRRRGIICKKSESKELCKSDDGFSLERTRGFVESIFEVKAADGAGIKMKLLPVRVLVEESDELWKLEPPRGFKIINQ